MMIQNSILKKTIFSNMLVIVTSFFLVGILVFSFLLVFEKKQKQNALSESSDYICDLVENSIYEDNTGFNISNSMMLQNMLNIFYLSNGTSVLISDINGNILMCSDGALQRAKFEQKINSEVINDVLKSKNYFSTSALDYLFAKPSYVSAKTLEFTSFDSTRTVGCVFVCSSHQDVNSLVHICFVVFVIAMLIALAVSYFISWYFSARLVNPLKEMSQAAKSFTEGDFSRRVTVNSNDEVGDLAKTFNNMAASVEAFENVRRTFVSNVSHELKTPMTTITGFIDGILDGTIPQDKQAYYLEIVSEEVKRLSRLVKTMQDLSVIDSNNIKMNITSLDIAELIKKICTTFEYKLKQKNISIQGLEDLTSLKIKGDYDMLYQVLYNLIENAVKFSNNDKYIKISHEENNDNIIINIQNSCNGIPQDKVPFVFDKFYKLDSSRSEDRSGMGLGLYIAKSIMHLHTGDITVKSKKAECCIFSVYFNKKLGK